MAEKLLGSEDLYESNQIAWRLSAQPLTTETQEKILEAIPRASFVKRGMLLRTLNRSTSDLMDETFGKWSSDQRIDEELRRIAKAKVIDRYGVEEKWDELLSIVRDQKLPSQDRLRAINALMKTKKRGDPSFKAILLSIASAPTEDSGIRQEAVHSLAAGFKLSESEVKIIDDILNDVEAPVMLRLTALLRLKDFKGVRPGDATWLRYLTSDPSFTFRKQLADALKGSKTFLAGDAVRVAIEAVQKEAREREKLKK
jgi:hypothetical protein